MEAAVREEIAQLAARRRETGRRTEQPAQGADDVNKQAAAPRKLAGAQADLLAALVRHGELGRPYLEQLSPEDFPEDARDIFAAVRSLTEEGEEISAQSVLAELPERARPLLAQLMLGAVPDERAGEAMASAVARIVEGRLKRQVAELSERFREAKSAEEQERIGKELAQIGIERSKLTKRRTIGEE
jgi:replicative DNA helicase